jgi:hypothetical protein
MAVAYFMIHGAGRLQALLNMRRAGRVLSASPSSISPLRGAGPWSLDALLARRRASHRFGQLSDGDRGTVRSLETSKDRCAPRSWKIAWPTLLANIVGGLQGIVDHVLRSVASWALRPTRRSASSWQIFLVVIVFISSLFLRGMSVLGGAVRGRGRVDKVDRVVYQASLRRRSGFPSG